MDGADLELFARSVRHATESHTGGALDAALHELGWHDALTIDARAAVSLLFELQGAANVTSSALEHLLAGALCPATTGATGVALPDLARDCPPGELDGKRVIVRGLGTATFADRATALVVARAGAGHVAVLVDTASLAIRPVRGVDPWLGLVEVTGDVPFPAEVGPVDWPTALALGQLAVGHELVGASRKMLELAREHAVGRIQFGRPISAFQAVRHRLAETLVAVEAADAVLGAAWLDRSPETAAIAKAVAGRSGRTAARHCQQVLAGIGFTTEHDLHRYVRRVLVLPQLLGATRSLTVDLGTALLAGRPLPVLPL